MKNKGFYFIETVFVFCWITYLYIFFNIYSDYLFYSDDRKNYLLKFIFFVDNYFYYILELVAAYFLLLSLNLLFIIIIFKILKKSTINYTKVMYGSLLITGLFAAIPLFSVAAPLFMLSSIAALIAVYIIWVITKDDRSTETEDSQVITYEGPYVNSKEAEQHLKDFVLQWENYYKEKGETLNTTIISDEDNYYFEVSVLKESNEI